MLGVGMDVFRRYTPGIEGELADEVVEMVRTQAVKRVAFQFVEQRRATWDHRKLGGAYLSASGAVGSRGSATEVDLAADRGRDPAVSRCDEPDLRVGATGRRERTLARGRQREAHDSGLPGTQNPVRRRRPRDDLVLRRSLPPGGDPCLRAHDAPGRAADPCAEVPFALQLAWVDPGELQRPARAAGAPVAPPRVDAKMAAPSLNATSGSPLLRNAAIGAPP